MFSGLHYSISDFLSFDVAFPTLGSGSVSFSSKSATFSYPCSNRSACTPYTINLSKGSYKFECWGSRGIGWHSSKPGLGAYTSGNIHIQSPATFYVYIGATGEFNSGISIFNTGPPGGGAADVRTTLSEEWFSFDSLKSRIMVSGGGGGSEWSHSIGGDGGTLVGGSSFSAIKNNDPGIFPEPCYGANQTHGGICPNYTINMVGYMGSFGISGSPLSTNDMGGGGGGGYYGGGSVDYTGAGSGGSSFISGYHGCDSISNHSSIFHTNSPFHYSGFYFQDGYMISGNETMPLPNGNEGIWSESHGKFRITIIGTLECFSCASNHFLLHTFTLSAIFFSEK